MNFVSIFDNLPDAVCVVDELGLILERNSYFKETISNSVAALNFPSDVLHQQHQHDYCAVLERIVSDRLAGNDERYSLGMMKSLTASLKSQQCKSQYQFQKNFLFGDIMTLPPYHPTNAQFPCTD